MANEDKSVLLANHFRVEVDGMNAGAFEEVVIEAASYEVVNNRVGTDPNYSLPCAGLENTQTITLRKAARDLDIGVKDFFSGWFFFIIVSSSRMEICSFKTIK